MGAIFDGFLDLALLEALCVDLSQLPYCTDFSLNFGAGQLLRSAVQVFQDAIAKAPTSLEHSILQARSFITRCDAVVEVCARFLH